MNLVVRALAPVALLACLPLGCSSEPAQGPATGGVAAGAGAIGASVAFHLASLGARDVVLADKGRVASGATAKAMGGVRQQFSTAAEVRLAQADTPRGNIEDAFKPADKVFEARYSTVMCHNAQMEPRSCVAHWEGDKLTVYTPTGGIANCHHDIARDLGIPDEKVRVVCHYIRSSLVADLASTQHQSPHAIVTPMSPGPPPG